VPRKRLSMRKITEVLRLHATGTSRRDIARALGVARSTVAEYLRRAETAGVSWPLPDGLDAEGVEALLFPEAEPTATRPVPDWAEVRKELKSRKHHMTLRLLWLEWKAERPEAWGYTQYCEHYRRWLATKDVVMRLAYAAGERMFVDFSGDKATWCDPQTGWSTRPTSSWPSSDARGCSMPKRRGARTSPAGWVPTSVPGSPLVALPKSRCPTTSALG